METSKQAEIVMDIVEEHQVEVEDEKAETPTTTTNISFDISYITQRYLGKERNERSRYKLNKMARKKKPTPKEFEEAIQEALVTSPEPGNASTTRDERVSPNNKVPP
uniref:Uncharacterized protein n=1 Tax=Kalanchoe fedtschenkoi TaxID=63787 RepID=A0A7N0UA67_KALFE